MKRWHSGETKIVSIRFSEETYQRAREAAFADCRTLSNFVEAVLVKFLDARPQEGEGEKRP